MATDSQIKKGALPPANLLLFGIPERKPSTHTALSVGRPGDTSAQALTLYCFHVAAYQRTALEHHPDKAKATAVDEAEKEKIDAHFLQVRTG